MGSAEAQDAIAADDRAHVQAFAAMERDAVLANVPKPVDLERTTDLVGRLCSEGA